MNLEIREENNILFVKGMLTAANSVNFHNTLKLILNKRKRLVLNLDQVSKIDTNGLFVLYKVFKNASIFDIQFKIEGKYKNRIYEEFHGYGIA